MSKALPDFLLQEIRNLLAVHCREVLMESKADGIKKDGQDVLMQKVFYGSSGYASVIDAFMAGKGFYASMFQVMNLETNRSGNDKRTGGLMLELLPLFHLSEGT